MDATHIPVQQRGIGMVFQSYALFRHMTVADNITFGPRIQDLDIDEEERYCTCTYLDAVVKHACVATCIIAYNMHDNIYAGC